jgi:tetratricopeptide (TPR) repeat protein
MIDYKQANALSKEALKLWGAGRLEEAADGYSRAIALVGTDQAGGAYFHAALAGVLKDLGRNGEATDQYEKALQAELLQAGSETDIGVKTARCFLASHLTSQGEAAKAKEVLAPSVKEFPNDWLVRSAQALSLFALGRCAEARTAAELAITNAGSDSKREQLAEHLQAVLAASND